MFLKAEFFARRGRLSLLTSGIALAAAMLAACTLGPPPPKAQPAVSAVPEAPVQPAASRASAPDANGAAGTGATAPATPASAAPASATEPTVVRILVYADRVRLMSGTELSQEATRLGATAYAPASQLQLALVLSQLRQTPELIRAQELLTRVLANTDAEALSLHSLARLLAARYGEQRRLEDQLEKQNQQTRDVQRRLDQTNERLEALKAIERSLTSRLPSPAASAPASRARAPAP